MKKKKIFIGAMILSVLLLFVGIALMFPESFGLWIKFADKDTFINGVHYGCEGWYQHTYSMLIGISIVFSPFLFLLALLFLIKLKS